jgi:signal transduction histidine kinase
MNRTLASLNRCTVTAGALLVASIGTAAWEASSPGSAGGRHLLLIALLCAAFFSLVAPAVWGGKSASTAPQGHARTEDMRIPANAANFDKEHAPHAFLLDRDGRILALSESLLSFSDMDTLGMNYLKVCDASAARGIEEAAAFAAGVRAVLRGDLRQHSGDYACRTERGDYWYRATATRLLHCDPPRFLVIHENITRHRDMEHALRQSALSIRELAGHQEAVREEERKRIAQEIHDDLGQQLLALRIDVSILQAGQAQNPALLSQLDAMQATIGNLVQSVRAIINDLRPAVLDLGLPAAAEWQLNEFTHKTGIASALHSDFADIALPDSHATALFRILQESLTNVSRHSGASRVEVRLALEDDRLLMSIVDNGQGMPTDAQKPDSFGLRGMRERIASLGGELEISSEPKNGVTVAAWVPLAQVPDETTREGYVARSPVDRRASRRTG